jgi:hypothetical protein
MEVSNSSRVLGMVTNNTFRTGLETPPNSDPCVRLSGLISSASSRTGFPKIPVLLPDPARTLRHSSLPFNLGKLVARVPDYSPPRMSPPCPGLQLPSAMQAPFPSCPLTRQPDPSRHLQHQHSRLLTLQRRLTPVMDGRTHRTR